MFLNSWLCIARSKSLRALSLSLDLQPEDAADNVCGMGYAIFFLSCSSIQSARTNTVCLKATMHS